MKIYVVMQIEGEYSDAQYKAIAAYRTLDAAQQRIRDDSKDLAELKVREGSAHGHRYPPPKSPEEIELYGDRYQYPETVTLYIDECELVD